MAAGAMMAAGGLPTGAAWAAFVVYVPCSTPALASDIAAASPGATLSLVAGCRYVLTAALPTVGRDLTITGNQATLARSRAPGTPAFTILTVDAGTLSVSGLNFVNGNDAIFATGTGSLVVTGGRFLANGAVDGGAINAYTSSGSLSVTGAAFVGNSASDAGGAIYSSESAGHTTVSDSEFRGNTASNAGGAIYDFNTTGASISGSRFGGNAAPYGGAIFDNSISGESVSGTVVHDNSASQDGGGLASVYTSTGIGNSVITGNHAALLGGGLYQANLQYSFVGLQLTGTSVRGNSAGSGGGVYSENDALQLTSSTVAGNTAAGDGAGIYNNGSPLGYDSVSLSASTVTGNHAAGNGGGVYNVGYLSASGSQITRNTAASGGGIYDGTGDDTDFVTLNSTQVTHNHPDDCAPPGMIPGCGSPVAMSPGRGPGRPAQAWSGRPWACHGVAGGRQVCCVTRGGRGSGHGHRICLPHLRAPMVAAGPHGPLPVR